MFVGTFVKYLHNVQLAEKQEGNQDSLQNK